MLFLRSGTLNQTSIGVCYTGKLHTLIEVWFKITWPRNSIVKWQQAALYYSSHITVVEAALIWLVSQCMLRITTPHKLYTRQDFCLLSLIMLRQNVYRAVSLRTYWELQVAELILSFYFSLKWMVVIILKVVEVRQSIWQGVSKEPCPFSLLGWPSLCDVSVALNSKSLLHHEINFAN